MRSSESRQLWSVLGSGVAGALLMIAVVTVTATAQPGGFRDEVEHAKTVFERTEEILEKISAEVREADVPKARDLLRAAVELEKRARRIFGEVTADSPILAARSRLRQSVTLSLRARDTGLQAGKFMREQVTFQRRAQRTLEQARERLGRLHDLGSGSGDSTARELLRRVQSQLDRAERQYRDGSFEIALRLGQTALELLQSLGSRDGGPTFDRRFESMLEQALVYLDRARQHEGALGESGRQRLARAEDLVRRSEEKYRSGHPRVAMGLLERARGLMGDLGSAADRPGPEEIRRAIERVERALADLTDQVDASAPSNVRRMLDRARQEHQRALRALRTNEVEQALRHHRATVDLLTRVRNWLDDRSR